MLQRVKATVIKEADSEMGDNHMGLEKGRDEIGVEFGKRGARGREGQGDCGRS